MYCFFVLDQPSFEHTFSVNQFTELENILKRVSAATCSNGQTPTLPPPPPPTYPTGKFDISDATNHYFSVIQSNQIIYCCL